MSATLAEVASALGVEAPEGSEGVVVRDVTHASGEVGPGTLFVAIAGSRHDGHRFVPSVGAVGAVGALVERPAEAAIPQLVTPDTRAAMAIAARVVHGEPDLALSIVGVTGTNGKTTVAHLCESAWRADGRSAGVIGTLGARFDGLPVPLARTTPESSDLQRLLARMRDAGVTSVAMEVSSHALELHRADAIRFTAVGFTNLSQDHLDFHGDMESYFMAKYRLFTPERSSRAVIDVDGEAGRRIAATTDLEVVTVGMDAGADISASDVWSTPTGTDFTLTAPSGSAAVRLPLAGLFNVGNALVAAGLLLCDGVGLDAIAQGFGSLAPVPGRMEVVDHDGPFTVIVDYAHTPEAIATVLSSLSHAADGRVIVVVGAGGDRDAAKRPAMGESAARYGDLVIVTTDNPRSEDPRTIAAEVVRGAGAVPGSDVRMILDRREAIATAIEIAAPGDIVAILGKGHEQGQEVGDRVLPFDDRVVASEALVGVGWGTP
jgi:UDP-N-acetylmuramoyl-L-alanyl-D-glutamate--2,6-diaminopimelate ligase